MENKWQHENNIQKLSSDEKREMLLSIQKKVREKRRQKRLYLYLSVSSIACVAMLAVLIKPFQSEPSVSAEDILTTVADIPVDEKDIQLILSNNKTITFEKDADIKYDDKEGITVDTGDNQIRASKVAQDKFALNTLIVPKGKRSSLTLADGSKVWVNSGTTLKFPSQFKSAKREIWVDGEIYIDVVSNKDCPFLVNTSSMVIDVVGTQFNVSSYQEDAECAVVLVEGRVNVTMDTGKTSLLPNQMLSVAMNNATVKEVDVSNYTSWKDGYLQFASEPLTHIMKRLSRYYNIPIQCSESSSALVCSGKLILFDNLDAVLETISNTLPIDFSFEEKQVVIEKRE